jgi:hypothetical protein
MMIEPGRKRCPAHFEAYSEINDHDRPFKEPPWWSRSLVRKIMPRSTARRPPARPRGGKGLRSVDVLQQRPRMSDQCPLLFPLFDRGLDKQSMLERAPPVTGPACLTRGLAAEGKI